MAYTYDDFVTAANTAGYLDQFTEQDMEAARRDPQYGLSMLSLKKDAANATTAEQRLLAQEAQNQLRSGAGGTGFSYAGQDAYQKLLDSVANHSPFQYDLEADPNWGAYKKAYMREGDRASANALAQAAAASGGRVSSWATTAAQQAGNYYAGQLTDMIPNLQQSAYAQYLSDFNKQLESLGALQSDRAFDYQAWMDEFARNYQQERDRLADEQWQKEFEYQLQRAAAADEQWRKEYEYQLQRAAAADAQWQKEYDEARRQAALKGSGSGSGSGSGTGSGSGSGTGSGSGSGAGSGTGTGGQTETVKKFIATHMTPEQAEANRISRSAYTAMIEQWMDQVELTDEEIMALDKHYGLELEKRMNKA